jgi:hypothetical protein
MIYMELRNDITFRDAHQITKSPQAGTLAKLP